MSARQEPPVEPLPPIPAKRYFTIGEVSELCGVKPHVLRYWEQEFSQLRPMKRRGNRRYYQHHEVLLVRRIRELLYEEGFTINGARNRLGDGAAGLARQRNGSAVQAVVDGLAVDSRERGVAGSEGAGLAQDLPANSVGEGALSVAHSGPFAPGSVVGSSTVPAAGLWTAQASSDDALRARMHEVRTHLEEAIRILSID